MTRQYPPRQMPTTNRAASLRFAAMAAEYLERMGTRIREAREAKGLSQSALARKLPGTTDGNQVSRWELGKHRPSDDTLEAIAAELDVDVTYFLAPAGEKDGLAPDPFQQPGTEARLAAVEAKLDRILSLLGAPAEAPADPLLEAEREALQLAQDNLRSGQGSQSQDQPGRARR